MLVHMQLEVGVNVVDVRFIKPVQVVSECVVVEPGGLKAWTKQLIQILLRGPFVHVHQGISTAQHVEYQQLDSFLLYPFGCYTHRRLVNFMEWKLNFIRNFWLNISNLY
ncbi:hypothetical protein SAMN02799630_01391 [Paenibacillus sp. UNCCL117]|nr:hypothetical protein SAMN04488602_103369 [Paenibacillus sp. cl123]SFW25413.1 hypothetical protein SAMN02799630_01391 [Paenibacillus sp. UNCCL117]